VWYFARIVSEPFAPPQHFRYLRTPRPLDFPSDEQVPESPVHLRVRTALFLVLDEKLRGRAFVGSDQFVYWDAADPRACLAPDVFVHFGGPFDLPRTFRTWDHGAPQLAIEVLSRIDLRDRDHEGRLERYRRCGVREVVLFDPESDAGLLRIWDWIEGDLVERDLAEAEARYSRVLGAYFRVVPDARLGWMLKISDDLLGQRPWLTADQERIAELEAELARRDAR
jgi:hypothetical protein